MFNYINYNVLNAILMAAVLFNAMMVYTSSAAAETLSKIRNGMPALYFTYSGENQKYSHFTAEGSLVAGRNARIVYDVKRKDVLFKNNSAVYMRYSFDFWQSCQDVELKRSVSGGLEAVIKLPANVSTIQIAFFAAYPYDNYRAWGFIWDSNYGKNFSANIISVKELEDKKKFESLNGAAEKFTENI